jgi:hypothetical protein
MNVSLLPLHFLASRFVNNVIKPNKLESGNIYQFVNPGQGTCIPRES